MIEQRFKCPVCGEISVFHGNPGEQQVVVCPGCHSKGRITIPLQSRPNGHAIEVTHLKKVYGDLIAVNDISFAVRKGEVFAFLGPNGAGKTTTVEMIESIRQPTSGTIKLLGCDIRTDFNGVKEKIGILPQEFHSFERLTVRETLLYFSNLFKKKADVDEIISTLDLTDHKNMLYKTLSGGLKQRVGVAIALVNDPEVIFLDEPTTGLDPKARREVWGVIAGLRKKGKTVFLTTHYMEEAEFLADHIAVIHKGKIIAEGSLEDLIQRYGSGSILHIKKCKDAADVVAMLKQEGFPDASSEGNSDIAVKIDYKERVLEILSHLRHDCVEYDSVDIRRSNLEEVFLRLTGSKLMEEEQ
ncbi:MAG TPA: ABC transporter ATP-binding protein [Candidatus Thermoplasmatota archaeon]|nr:ABC transporter ATP-binding protein [Candidatus Thermoplasmatota archaeon]